MRLKDGDQTQLQIFAPTAKVLIGMAEIKKQHNMTNKWFQFCLQLVKERMSSSLCSTALCLGRTGSADHTAYSS